MACGLGLVVSMKVYRVESACRKLLSYYSTPLVVWWPVVFTLGLWRVYQEGFQQFTEDFKKVYKAL